MRKLFAIALLFFLVACKQSTSLISETLNQSNIDLQSFQVNTTVDTILKTKGGILIQIDAGTIVATSASVTIQVKEALTVYDMIAGNLLTKSDQGILSSSGMFYLTTKESSTISKPIKISVPTAYANKSMSLFKGKQDGDAIIWTEPKPLQTKTTDCIAGGENLFKTNCTSCHEIEKKLTGPALGWIEDRWPDRNELRRYIRNNTQLFREGNKRAMQISCEYNYLAMTIFDNLSDSSINCILAYINKESERLRLPHKTGNDSCAYYNAYYQRLTNIRDSLSEINGLMTKVEITPPTVANTSGGSDSATNLPMENSLLVEPPSYNAEYYQFEINAYGWYNVDILLKDLPDMEDSKLFVRIKGEINTRIKVFLVIPSIKAFVDGGLLDDGTQYGFYKKDGSLKLPQLAPVFVLAMSEQNKELYYGITSFTATTSQTIEVSLKAGSKDEILKSLHELKLENATFDIGKAKNFDGISSVDKEIQRVKQEMLLCSPCMEQARDISDSSGRK